MQSQIQRIEDTIRQVQTSSGEERQAWARLFAAQMDVYLEGKRAEGEVPKPARAWEGQLRALHTTGLLNKQIAAEMGKSHVWVRTRLHYIGLEANLPPEQTRRKRKGGGAK